MFLREFAMYIPPHFQEIDQNEITALIEQNPLACLVTNSNDGLVANHIPLLKGGDSILVGHIAANNDLHRLVENGSDILAIFRGSDAYISPNDYPTKREHHKHVPTWNYQVVHIYGTIHFSHDEKTKRAAVGVLTQKMERAVNGTGAWRMADAPKDYLATMLDNIVALKINITRILGKSKLSQNREEIDYQGAISGLEERGHQVMADTMRKSREI